MSRGEELLMRIALAQLSSDPRDLLERHIEAITAAAKEGCALVAFPELSLTGYHPTTATQAPLRLDEMRITALEEACQANAISALVGAPLATDAGVLIATLSIDPGRRACWYAKRHLHEDETPFFIEGDREPLLECGGARVGIAICYELFIPEHRQRITSHSPHLIIASVAKHTRGLERARSALSEHARAHHTPTLLVNGAGPCEGFVAVGGSCWFDVDGADREHLGTQPGLLVIDIPSAAS